LFQPLSGTDRGSQMAKAERMSATDQGLSNGKINSTLLLAVLTINRQSHILSHPIQIVKIWARSEH